MYINIPSMLLRRFLQQRTDITMDRENTNTTRHPSMPRIAYRMMSESCVLPSLRGGLVVESDAGSVSVSVGGGSVGGVQPLMLSQRVEEDVGDTLTEVVVATCVTVRVVGRLDSEMVVVQA